MGDFVQVIGRGAGAGAIARLKNKALGSCVVYVWYVHGTCVVHVRMYSACVVHMWCVCGTYIPHII